MKIEYAPDRDLLYICFADIETKAAETVKISPGVYADFDRDGKLMGIEVIEAVMGKKINPKALESIQRGLKQASRGKIKNLNLDAL